MRTGLFLGFNEDEKGRKVYDAAFPTVATVMSFINIRFAESGRADPDEYSDKGFPSQDFPTTYGDLDDTIGHLKGGVLDRCQKTNTCPKIFHSFTDAEYWQFTARSDTTDAPGKRDVDIPDNVRIYHLAGNQHGSFSPGRPLPTSRGICEQLPNTNTYTYNVRALMVELQQWVANGTEPPPNSYARISDGTLVPLEQFKFLKLPGVTGPEGSAGVPTGVYGTRVVYDRGPRFHPQTASGIIDIEPPKVVAVYPGFVPKINADGNPIDGVHSPILDAPLGTYTGWNIRAADHGQGDSCSVTGSFIPFAVFASDRAASGDPRPSLQERYTNKAGYTKTVTAAVNALVRKRLMLASDAVGAIQAATDWFTQASGGKLP
jgi:hypothetical protein